MFLVQFFFKILKTLLKWTESIYLFIWAFYLNLFFSRWFYIMVIKKIITCSVSRQWLSTWSLSPLSTLISTIDSLKMFLGHNLELMWTFWHVCMLFSFKILTWCWNSHIAFYTILQYEVHWVTMCITKCLSQDISMRLVMTDCLTVAKFLFTINNSVFSTSYRSLARWRANSLSLDWLSWCLTVLLFFSKLLSMVGLQWLCVLVLVVWWIHHLQIYFNLTNISSSIIISIWFETV